MKKTILTLLTAAVVALTFVGCKKEVIEPQNPQNVPGPGPGPNPVYLMNDYRIEFEIYDNAVPSVLSGAISITDTNFLNVNGVNHNYETIIGGHLYEEVTLNDVPDSINVYATYHLNGMYYLGGWNIDVNDQLSIKIYRNDTLVHTEFGFNIGDSNPIWLNN